MKTAMFLIIPCLLFFSSVRSFESKNSGYVLKVLNDCLNSTEPVMCFKKKAIVFLDNLGRVEKFSLSENVEIVHVANVSISEKPVTEKKLDEFLPRAHESKNAELNRMFFVKMGELLQSTIVKVSFPSLTTEEELSEGQYVG